MLTNVSFTFPFVGSRWQVALLAGAPEAMQSIAHAYSVRHYCRFSCQIIIFSQNVLFFCNQPWLRQGLLSTN